MRVNFVLLLLALLGAGVCVGEPSFTPRDFADWFQSARRQAPELTSGERDEARATEYVFIAGWNNEKQPDYFESQMDELRRLGVAESSIHLIRPPSDAPTERNVSLLNERLERIAAKAPGRKLVLVAHSRGAVAAMQFALGRPDFVRDRVKSIFFVQGAFQGSGIADFVRGVGPGHFFDGRLSIWDRVLMLFSRLRRGSSLRRDPSISELTTRAASRRRSDFLRSAPDAIAALRDRAFYIRSRLSPTKQEGLTSRLSAKYLDAYFGPNDGLLTPDGQWIEGIGRPLLMVDGAGHNDFTNAKSRAPETFRRAMARAIFASASRSRSLASAAPDELAEQSLNLNPFRCEDRLAGLGR